MTDLTVVSFALASLLLVGTILLLVTLTYKNRAIIDLLKENSAVVQANVELGDASEALRAELEQTRNQREAYRELIEDIQAERDRWMEYYYSQATGHDNAQRWMMREHQELSRQVKQLGGEPRVSSQVSRVRAAYEAEHGPRIEDHASGKAKTEHEAVVREERARAEAIERPPRDVPT